MILGREQAVTRRDLIMAYWGDVVAVEAYVMPDEDLSPDGLAAKMRIARDRIIDDGAKFQLLLQGFRRPGQSAQQIVEYADAALGVVDAYYADVALGAVDTHIDYCSPDVQVFAYQRGNVGLSADNELYEGFRRLFAKYEWLS
jgi:hypothetical protein